VVGSVLHLAFGLPKGSTGNDGVAGAQGPPFANAIIDSVTTLNPGDTAGASVSFDGTNVHFSFALPRGAEGVQGTPGANGIDGLPGAPGSQGPPGLPFAAAIVDSVTTLPPGNSASVTTSFDGNNVHFQFAIPSGFNGNNGSNGTDGAPGAPGTPGAPGEVSNAQLSTAINGTSSNTNAVATIDSPFVNDPPTLADLETMRAKMNELILALRR